MRDGTKDVGRLDGYSTICSSSGGGIRLFDLEWNRVAMWKATAKQWYALRSIADPVMYQSVTETGSSQYFQR